MPTDWAEIQAQRDAIYATGGKPVLLPPSQRETGAVYTSVQNVTEARQVMAANILEQAPESRNVAILQAISKDNEEPVPIPDPLIPSDPLPTIPELQLGDNAMPNAITLPYITPTNSATTTGFFDSLGNLGSMLPLLLIMMMMGKGGNNGMMMPLIMLMMMGGSLNAGTLGTANIEQVFAWSLLPQLGTTAALLLGGVSGLIGQTMGRKPRRRTYTRYRNRYVNRYYRRRY